MQCLPAPGKPVVDYEFLLPYMVLRTKPLVGVSRIRDTGINFVF
jgi:hypothetical protein